MTYLVHISWPFEVVAVCFSALDANCNVPGTGGRPFSSNPALPLMPFCPKGMVVFPPAREFRFIVCLLYRQHMAHETWGALREVLGHRCSVTAITCTHVIMLSIGFLWGYVSSKPGRAIKVCVSLSWYAWGVTRRQNILHVHQLPLQHPVIDSLRQGA